MTINQINSIKYKQIQGLRESGLSYAEIARRLGLSRERIRQIDQGISVQKKRQPNNESMLTSMGVSRILGVHVNTVRRWSDKGILSTYIIGPRGDRRFKREDIQDFLGRNRYVAPK